MPARKGLETTVAESGSCADRLGVSAAIFWVYFRRRRGEYFDDDMEPTLQARNKIVLIGARPPGSSEIPWPITLGLRTSAL